MLEPNKLDDKTYREILEAARARVAESAGGWTDHNAHDPGITLLELFSYLTEMQRYYIERSAEPSLLGALIGAKPLHAAPAVSYAELRASRPGLTLPSGTPVYAGDLRFETTSGLTLPEGRGVVCLKNAEGEFPEPRVKVFFPFGEQPEPERRFEVLMDCPLPAGGGGCLSVLLAESYARRQKERDLGREPLTGLKWEYLTGDGYDEVKVADGSQGFIFSGDISFFPVKPMVKNKDGFYALRCTLISKDPGHIPALAGLQLCVAKLEQRHSLCRMIGARPGENAVLKADTYLAKHGESVVFRREGAGLVRSRALTRRAERGAAVLSPNESCDGADEVLIVSWEREYLHRRVAGVATGFPNQRFWLDTRGQAVEYDSFELIISDDPELERAELWKKTEALYLSGPDDRHYTLDEISGEIRFGDGFHGRMPRGAVIIASMALTQGGRGAAKAGRLEDFMYEGLEVSVRQNRHAKPGADREEFGQALERAVAPDGRAVTAEDYERLVRLTPRLAVDKVSVFPTPEETGADFSVTVAVKLCGSYALEPAHKLAILRWLEPYRLAGTELLIEAPALAHISVTAELRGSDDGKNVGAAIETKLRDFFSRRYRDFGQRIRQSEIFAFLDALAEVRQTERVHIGTDSACAEILPNGDALLRRHCVALPGSIIIIVR